MRRVIAGQDQRRITPPGLGESLSTTTDVRVVPDPISVMTFVAFPFFALGRRCHPEVLRRISPGSKRGPSEYLRMKGSWPRQIFREELLPSLQYLHRFL